MATPKYVERISRLPGVFEHLLAHPDGMPLRQLADDFHVDPDMLREDLLAFYAADVSPDLLLGLMRPGVLEFLGPDGDDEDPAAAEIVKISDPRSIDELGVEYVDASELALIYTAATSLLDVEPDNSDLAAAIDALSETMLGDAAPDGAGPAPWNRLLEPIAEGQKRRVRVDIVYSRAWEVGVSERTIEPYRLVRTRRGWEVDAGPIDDRGKMRTFLLSNIRDARRRGRDVRAARRPRATSGGATRHHGGPRRDPAVRAMGRRHVRRAGQRGRRPGDRRRAGAGAPAAARAPARAADARGGLGRAGARARGPG